MTTQRTTAVEQTSVPVEWQAPVSFLVSFYKARKANTRRGKQVPAWKTQVFRLQRSLTTQCVEFFHWLRAPSSW